tara:strand:+ start:3291 stop:3593 length:303 start_codon:yes stop_codon:yes gene_type:complete
MSRYRYEEKVARDFDSEARELIKPLSEFKLYELYAVVQKEKLKSNKPERDQELIAVHKAIELTRGIDQYRLNFIINGYKTEMAQTGRPQDGARRPWRKQV